ncbi:4-(cytidine 5'-diphospho)-2-C-methyl-D-erythritol kinase [Acuticoccus kandeliae]|uniref:4-(cytidine 5'-diphospho)-2-C-methyl-D-erythritol kinase n=1 Tax=Acuticoccus kandeliae TaxID=2073160 RepID=UPI000D3E999F|nr:4-(cytidine 5'-diphospho)-2-C-methyl-D-erythritol kinase [Acuticoccus kandeliae]
MRVDAPAKINLALHVTGQRADGYHLLDSLVAFARIADGDRLTVAFGDAPPRLTIDGPFAADVPPGADNIVVRAATACGGIAAIHLHKGLPVASGIGGGSADAAAVLRAAASTGSHTRAALSAIALGLGADVPVCLAGAACRMSGIGEILTPVALPAMPALLVNPRVPVETRAVFKRLARKDNPPLPPLPLFATTADVARWLAETRNDLEAPAIALAPAIAETLDAVRGMAGCLFARMSGSGATVFALFSDAAARDAAAARLAEAAPGWWVAPAEILPSAG